jgi:NAD(P)-dependent dehydrogenase (short-subunit alcohol dehydrogenase family)
MYVEMFEIKNKIAIVTGGAGGLGKAIARGFAELENSVVVADVVGEQARETANEIENETGSTVKAIETNVCVKEEVEELIQCTVKEFGRIDILVNGAGIIHRPRTEAINFSEEAWDRVHAVNLKGVFFCCQIAAKEMIKRKQGKIINIASTSGMRAVKNHVAYCTSKGGVIQMTKALALELADYNIQVNAIAPYVIRTSLTEVTLRDEAKRKTILSNIPLGRIGEPSDVVGCCVFLASSASDWMTGQTLVVDGGATA